MSRDTIDKVDVARRMARVKAWSRNGDVLELLDVLEHVMKCWGPKGAYLSSDSTADETVSRDNRVKAAGCPECSARRAADLARQRRRRDKAAKGAQTKAA